MLHALFDMVLYKKNYNKMMFNSVVCTGCMPMGVYMVNLFDNFRQPEYVQIGL